MSDNNRTCSACEREEHLFNRREFIRTTAAAGIAATSASCVTVRSVSATERQRAASETLVQQLHSSLADEQKKLCTYPFGHEKQYEIDNNWRINDSRVAKHFTEDQQELIRQIFLQLHSAQYAQSVYDQVEHDNKSRGGFGGCSIALFGQPQTGKFEFVFTGRHVTRRCDGDSVEGAAFGGPIFYGHAAKSFNEAPDHPGNIYWYQAKRANELFQALDGKQRKQALLDSARPERKTETVMLSGKQSDLAGIPWSEFSADQKELAEKVMQDVLAPFRQEDRDESMKLIHANGLEDLHFSYYNNAQLDIGNDGVWDVWQIEGPAMLWYFRGAPHVHTWVHIRQSA